MIFSIKVILMFVQGGLGVSLPTELVSRRLSSRELWRSEENEAIKSFEEEQTVLVALELTPDVHDLINAFWI